MRTEDIIADMRLHRTARSASTYASDRVYPLLDEIDALRRHRDDIHEANNRYLERARKAEADLFETRDRLTGYIAAHVDHEVELAGKLKAAESVINDIAAYFDAADIDGLQERINEVQFCQPGSWSDIVIRFLLPAGELARSFPASNAVAWDGDISGWEIDHSTGRPILTYKKCSVIEAEDAEFVLRAIRAALSTAAPVSAEPQPVAWGDMDIPVTRSLLEAAIRELREWKVEKGGDDQVVLNLEAALRMEATSKPDLAAENARLRKELVEKRRDRIGDAEISGSYLCRAENAETDNARLMKALERIASHEAFLCATPDIHPELKARMEYADAILKGGAA